MVRENDLTIGQKMAHEDLTKTNAEAQLEAYKRHEMSKALRSAWTQQQQVKESAKAVEKIF